MRPYYSQSPLYSGYSGFGYTTPKLIKSLIAINVAAFVLIHLTPQFGWLRVFGLVPRYVFARLHIWQLATYMFLHAGLWHLAINMLMFWFFAPTLVRHWGEREFLSYYFFTGIGAGLCSWLTAPASFIPVIGASGAIFGILVAYAMMFPDAPILLFLVFPMKMRQVVWLFAGMNLLGALSNPHAGIAYFAHLGGGLFGYLYLKSELIRRKISYLRLSSLRPWWRSRRPKKAQRPKEDLTKQADTILDKVAKYGIGSLTKKEKRILEAQSRKK